RVLRCVPTRPSSDRYDVDFNTKARHGRWRHNASGEYNREFTDEVKTTENWEAEYALDRFITDKFFWQGRGEHKRDKIEDLERQRDRKSTRLNSSHAK